MPTPLTVNHDSAFDSSRVAFSRKAAIRPRSFPQFGLPMPLFAAHRTMIPHAEPHSAPLFPAPLLGSALGTACFAGDAG